MKVVIIGSGNVASILGRLIKKSSNQLLQIVSRNPIHAKELADELGVSFAGFDGPINRSADVYILAVSDMALTECAPHFNIPEKLILHTAGSVSMEILRNCSYQYGVLYPLQSLRKDSSVIPHIPFLVDGNNSSVTRKLIEFAQTLSNEVAIVHDEDRLKLHAAAVIVNNFTNHLYTIAEDFCNKEQVDFNLLKPLILETATRVMNISPSKVQTGPAVRKDILTMDKHLRLLNRHPKIRTTYLRMTDSIMNP